MALEIHLSLKSVKMNTNEIMAAVRGDKLGKYAATEWLRLYRPYMPYEPRSTDIDAWEITHKEPYAHYDYEGNVMGPSIPINGGESFFSPVKPKHYTGARLRFAHGSDHWDEKAKGAGQADKLARAMQAFIDGGGLF